MLLNDSSSKQITQVDFGSAGLYVGGLQTVAAVIVASCVSILSCWLLPNSIISGVRTLVATATVSFLVVYKAVRIGRVRGVSMLFSALRPCLFVYLLALTLEELGHGTCRGEDEYDVHSIARRVIYHASTFIMMTAAFARAHSPRSDSDLPFTFTVICLAVIAVLPTPSSSSHGPLSQSPKTLMDAGERVLRATLFSFVYSMHVYASAPQRNIGSELLICVGRATAASVWILCCSPIILLAFPAQAALCIGMSISFSNNSIENEYEAVSLNSNSFPTNEHQTYPAREDGLERRYGATKCPQNGDNLSTTDSEHDSEMHTIRSGSALGPPHPHAEMHTTRTSSRNNNNNNNNYIQSTQAHEESDTEDASLSCSSDMEIDFSRHKYGVFQPILSSALTAPHSTASPGLSFSFSTSTLQQVGGGGGANAAGSSCNCSGCNCSSMPSSTDPSPALIAAALAREGEN